MLSSNEAIKVEVDGNEDVLMSAQQANREWASEQCSVLAVHDLLEDKLHNPAGLPTPPPYQQHLIVRFSVSDNIP